ncbi:hypothetical protein [Streptomyces sp. NPDC008150]|uniref:effector-associated constant component EACC1 n=1 Tax=Streptomyces sp. NPDC008150 TaxID=3364816 RepID=UPI0036EBAEE4
MEIDITCGGAGAAEPASLRRWLVEEPQVRRNAVVTLKAPVGAEPGAMGGALEVVNVVLTQGIALGSLVVAVLTWRGTRPRPPQVTLEHDGTVVTLRDGSAEEIERILRLWESAATRGPLPAPSPDTSGDDV